jgi:hypothetical protein
MAECGVHVHFAERVQLGQIYGDIFSLIDNLSKLRTPKTDFLAYAVKMVRM